MQDLLLGRADNGQLWLWDLSERLGWADGSQQGSWIRRATAAAGGGDGGGAEGAWGDSQGGSDYKDFGHLDEEDFEMSPLGLGCMPLPWLVDCPGGGYWAARPAVWAGPAWLAGLTTGSSGGGEGGAEEGEGEGGGGSGGPGNRVLWGALAAVP